MDKDDKMRKALSAYVAKTHGFYSQEDMGEFISKSKLNTRALECSATGRVNKNFYICEQTVFMKDKSKAEAGNYLCVCADCYDVLTIAIPDYLVE